MKEDILNVIESKVSPLIKVWMNDGKSFVPDDYIEEMTERLNRMFDDVNPMCSLFYGVFDIRMVSYSFEYYLSHFYYMLMVISGDSEDVDYVMNLIKNKEA